MKISSQREVIVEIERVTLIRKRAGTSVEWCSQCLQATDFISLVKAADLFGITPSGLLEFARHDHCHFIVGTEGEIHLCLVDLLAAMSKNIERGTRKLIGEQSE